MSNAQPTPSHPRSDVRNTVGKDKQTPQGSARTTSAVDLEEFCEKHYEKLLPIMADKYEHERRKKEKLEEVKARLDFGDVRKRTTKTQESAYSESRTRSPRRHRRSHSPRQSSSVFTRLKRERSRSPRHDQKNKARRERKLKYTENYSESEDSEGGHWKSKLRRKKSSIEDDDLSQPWATAKNGRRWAMPTWCHMFNSTLTENARVWFDDLPPESIDSYNDLREAFLKNYLQHKKCIREPIMLHNIKQRDKESTEDFIQRYKSESGNVKGAPECMRISGFVHGITNPELIKRFHEKIPKTVDEMMQVPRQITLLVKVGDDEHSTSTWMDFMVVKSTSPFNGIIERPGLRKMKAVPSTMHGMIKFPVMGGTLTLRSSKIIPIECAMISGPKDQPPPVNKVKEERIKVAINPEQTIMIGSDLTEKTRSKLCNLLQRSLDIFAWTPTDMTGVPRQIAEHRLNVRKGYQPVRQKKRGQAAERNVAINDEVSKFVTARIMREVRYHDWLSNPVMVKKSDNTKESVKGQVLADFIVERPEEEGQDDSTKEEEPLPARWTLFTDGSSCVDGCGAGVILTDPEGVEFTYALRFQFEATNNEAEYEALIAGLRIAEKIGVQNLEVNVDSKLVANQVNGTYIAKETDMIKYLEKVKALSSTFRAFSIKQVPRSKNKKADALSKMASTSFAHLSKQVLVEELKEKSVNEREVLAVVLLADNAQGCKGAYKSMSGMPSAQTHPKKSAGKIKPNHISVAVLQMGYNIETFPERPWQSQISTVAMDYITQVIEAKPVATITRNQVKKFVWENIVYRFGLPREIISDNGKQFRDNPFRDWCEKLCIQQHFASVKHPQTNGLVEIANRILGEGIKARLGKDNKNWLEEISHVLWAHRTRSNPVTRDTPFFFFSSLTTERKLSSRRNWKAHVQTSKVDVAENEKHWKST
ncbi:reverse transcriptase domain-containing protein [Tanacetum coccineum]|uniref:Reverse transcriptase domain-containing protein n=1 Tax=Tanacetum coccineum TaxID=301880 RepID=A0ABQ5E6B2_9ASTR